MRIYHVPDQTTIIQRWQNGQAGGPGHYVSLRRKYLERAGHSFVDDLGEADLTVGHGVIQSAIPLDVLHIAAVWPVDLIPNHPAFWAQHNAIMRQSMLAAGTVIVHSEFTAKLVRHLAGVEPVIVPQAIDPEEWSDVTPVERADDRPLVLWAKTSVDVLRNPRPAVSLAAMMPDTTIALTADRAVVEALTGPAPNNVLFLGRLTYADYQSWLAACDVYLATTLESSGQGQLEAMHLGKPVAGYDWGGVAETVLTGRYGCGELVQPGDVDALAEAVHTCLRRATSYGRKGQRHVEQYIWPQVIERLIDVYEEAFRDRL